MNKKNGCLAVVGSLVMLVAGQVAAGTYDIADVYNGADTYGLPISGEPDAVGGSPYQIYGMNVSFAGSTLSVRIDTDFAGRADEHLAASYTRPQSGTDAQPGIGFGDLFLSGAWDPDGSAPYNTDQASTGTVWTYALVLDDRWADSGTLSLYQIISGGNEANTLLSDDFIRDGFTGYRLGQEVAVATDALAGYLGATVSGSRDITLLGNVGTWSTTIADSSGYGEGKRFIDFQMDLAGTDLMTSDDIALHWALTCANDVIEGSVLNGLETPIPAAAWLFGSALAGFIGLSRRRKAAA